MKINYTFNNGENSEVEVNEELGAVILESRRKEENMERNRRRRCYSLDDITRDTHRYRHHRQHVG